MSAETTPSSKKDRLPHVQPGGGRISPRRRTLFKGTKAETTAIVGEVLVRGDAHFIDKGITPFGPNDAIDIRRKIAGKEPHEPFHKKVARSRGRVEDLKRAKRPGGNAERRAPAQHTEAAATVVQVPVASDLQTQLDAFKDDPEMQDKVIANWKRKRAAAAKTAAADAPADLPPPPPPIS